VLSWILADGGQLIGVLLILAGAVGYITLYYRRTVKGGTGCGCGCGTTTKRPATNTESSCSACRIEEREETKPQGEDSPPET
jgi:hypothetical protein